MVSKKKEQPLYQVENLVFRYALGQEKIEALRYLNVEIPRHALITLSGPSGSGKSTFLNVLGLIEPVQGGRVLFLDDNISLMDSWKKNQIRKYKIGFIFQDFHLMPVLTAEENVSYFLQRQRLPRSEIQQRTQEALEAVGLHEHRKKKPYELSGGQKQRVAIARALAKRPEVIIGDEPTASLDRKNGKEMMEILSHMVKEKKISVILATHDPMVQSFADKNLHIQDGKLID